MDLKQALNQAELKARQRDSNLAVNLEQVAAEEKKANEQGFTIVKRRNTNKAGFVQSIKENIGMLVRNKYLTNAELAFVYSLHELVELHSNAIVDPETGQFLTVSEIARTLKRNVKKTSTMINDLIDKGIIYEFVNVHELKEFGRAVSERPFFMNPEIVLCGDRNRINATLSRLVLMNDQFEKKKIPLAWKLWLHPNDEYGKLYRRKTYLKYKKGAKRP
ncbi:hypothetical protein GCM10007416_05170 [Kroppenstedtia guangzhouensis]|uniref:MarR family transcriptional regulator n=1 Tax=Kroppenstedtia guangzhouensis TaxID=1274356 RepID=A0ABQ1G4H5_9BACL|nr:hypothetical protein [Kroppenstedtia guangzhouensis]GGA35285.1 hypothetical protein GCM10007416_05170 [Kroppenstedtia guangzhouensis]